MRIFLSGIISFLLLSGSAFGATAVDLSNYEVAESDIAFSNITKFVGTNKFFHFPVGNFDLNNQTVMKQTKTLGILTLKPVR